MKGIAIRTVILLVLAVIVMGIALWFLTYVTNFDSLFLSNDQRLLKQYSTCALAYCASGAGSDEVNAVGCLKYESGRCTLTCADVKKKIYDENNVKPTVYEVGGRGAPHYCGSDANLTFQFSGVSLGGTVPLASGQMDKIATQPEWVCKPVKVPFTDIEFDSFGIDTAGAQWNGNFAPAGFIPISFPQNCVILSGRVSPIFPGRDGCFLPIKYDRSYDSIYYTPLIEYDQKDQIIYPSAIYVDASFTDVLAGATQPDCGYRNLPNHAPVSEQEINDTIHRIINSPAVENGTVLNRTNQQYYDYLGSQNRTEDQKKFVQQLVDQNQLGSLSDSGNNLIGNVLGNCNFKTQYGGKKITYYVWAKPVYPTLNALANYTNVGGFENFIGSLLKSTSPDLYDGFNLFIGQTQDFATLAFSQLGGSCTSVVLGRDLSTTSSSSSGSADVVQDITISTDQKTYPASGLIKFSGQLIMTSGSPNNREITVDYIYPTLNGILQSMKASTDNDGKFSGEFKIPSTGGGTGFILQASFLDKKVSSNPFNIGG